MPSSSHTLYPDPRVIYADIIDLPHPRSANHPPMSLYARAAQFAPFAALTGYEDMISEESRMTDEKIELGEEALERLNQELSRLSALLEEGKKPRCRITWFVPDQMKSGGSYATSVEEVRRMDPAVRTLVLSRTVGPAGSYAVIEIDDILEIEIL